MNLKAYSDGKAEARLKKLGVKPGTKSVSASKLTPQQEILKNVSKWVGTRAELFATSEDNSKYWKFFNYPAVLRIANHLPNYLNVMRNIVSKSKKYSEVTSFITVASSKSVNRGKEWWSKEKFEKVIEETRRPPWMRVFEYVIKPEDTAESIIELIKSRLG